MNCWLLKSPKLTVLYVVQRYDNQDQLQRLQTRVRLLDDVNPSQVMIQPLGTSANSVIHCTRNTTLC